MPQFTIKLSKAYIEEHNTLLFHKYNDFLSRKIGFMALSWFSQELKKPQFSRIELKEISNDCPREDSVQKGQT